MQLDSLAFGASLPMEMIQVLANPDIVCNAYPYYADVGQAVTSLPDFKSTRSFSAVDDVKLMNSSFIALFRAIPTTPNKPRFK
jgi:hypothetical protein